jgi:hypothetical protein
MYWRRPSILTRPEYGKEIVMHAASARNSTTLDFHSIQGQIAWAIFSRATLLA